MPPTWEQLVGEGWKQRSTKRRSFVSPEGKVVNSRRDITGPSRDDIGDILFPGRGLKMDPEIPQPKKFSFSKQRSNHIIKFQNHL